MRFLTAGESHGPMLTAIIEGVPAGLILSADDINQELARRQLGYGRGGRMKIEKDSVRITSGVRHGKTLGSPITLVVENCDWVNWQDVMGVEALSKEMDVDKIMRKELINPRPGHADLVGGIKYRHRDLRNVLERASARETAMRVAVGAVGRQILKALGIEVFSAVHQIGGVKAQGALEDYKRTEWERIDASPVRCLDQKAADQMMVAIDRARLAGDSLGGHFEVAVTGLPAGIGSYVHYDRKLDSRLAKALISIQAVKGVEFGLGFLVGERPGSVVHDEITWNEEEGYRRMSNRLGGLEGGMTTGEVLSVRAVMKPIATLYTPLRTVNIRSKEVVKASVERSDTTAVPAAAVVAENVVAWELAAVIVEQFYGDTMKTLATSVAELRTFARRF